MEKKLNTKKTTPAGVYQLLPESLPGRGLFFYFPGDFIYDKS